MVVAVTAEMRAKIDASLLYLYHMKHALEIELNTNLFVARGRRRGRIEMRKTYASGNIIT